MRRVFDRTNFSVGRGRNGYIAFTSILVISIVALMISTSISLLGIGESKSALDYKKGQETLVIAESCAEEALLRLRNDDTYLGGSLNLGGGSCTINIENVDDNFTIDIQAEIAGPPNYVKRIQVEAVRAGNSMNIISWAEI